MALRWDLKPVFKNADPDGELILFTRRTIMSGTLALVGFGIITRNFEFWEYLIAFATVALAFDAGDMRTVFQDDEPEKLEDGSYVTPHDRFYQPER